MTNTRSAISRRRLMATAVGTAVVVAGFPAIVRSQQAKRLLKPIVAGLNGKEGDPSYNSIALIPKILREKYDVQIEMQIHPAQTLGSLESQAEGVQTGFIDITSFSSSQLSFWTDTYEFLDLPYVLSSWDMALRFYNSDLFRRLATQVESKVKVRMLPPVGAGGFRILWNRQRPLASPDDVRGLKFRTTASAIEQSLIRAWGGNPTVIPFNEAYVGIQQGVIDGFYVQPIWNFNFKFFEVLKHGTHVQANFATQLQVMNAATFNAMPEAIQKAFMAAAQDAAEIANPQDRELEARFTRELQGKGVQIHTPSPAELAKWRDKGQQVWSGAKFDQSLVRELQAMS